MPSQISHGTSEYPSISEEIKEHLSIYEANNLEECREIMLERSTNNVQEYRTLLWGSRGVCLSVSSTKLITFRTINVQTEETQVH